MSVDSNGEQIRRFLRENRVFWMVPLGLALALLIALMVLPATDVAPPFRY